MHFNNFFTLKEKFKKSVLNLKKTLTTCRVKCLPIANPTHKKIKPIDVATLQQWNSVITYKQMLQTQMVIYYNNQPGYN